MWDTNSLQVQNFKIDGGMQDLRQTVTGYRLPVGWMVGFSQTVSGRKQNWKSLMLEPACRFYKREPSSIHVLVNQLALVSISYFLSVYVDVWAFIVPGCVFVTYELT